MSDSLLYLDGVSVSFDGFRALNGMSLALRPGEMRAVIGPNGAGKTTMMDVITGKTRPDTGHRRRDRRAVRARSVARGNARPLSGRARRDRLRGAVMESLD